MRLLYLTADPGVPVLGGKGASVHVRAMVRGFVEVGHEVVVASPRLEPGEEELPDGVRAVPIPPVRPRSLKTAAEVTAAIDAQAAAVRRLASAARIDAIYERYSLSSCAGARVSNAAGIPLIVEVNAPLRDEERRFRRLAHEAVAIGAEQETFAAATLIVAVSHRLRDWLVSSGAERVTVIPNPAANGAPASRSTPGAADTLTVGFAGSLKPWHGIATLLEGVQAAVARGGRMRLEVVGDGPEAAAVERATARSPQITRLGHLAHRDLLARMRGWDVGVAPYASLDGGFYFSPLKLGEYMAAGLCPVVSDVGSLAETVERGRAGVVIPPDDGEALCAALLALDADRDRLARLARRARQLAAHRPTWTDVAERLSRVLAASAAREPAGARPAVA